MAAFFVSYSLPLGRKILDDSNRAHLQQCNPYNGSLMQLQSEKSCKTTQVSYLDRDRKKMRKSKKDITTEHFQKLSKKLFFPSHFLPSYLRCLTASKQIISLRWDQWHWFPLFFQFFFLSQQFKIEEGEPKKKQKEKCSDFHAPQCKLKQPISKIYFEFTLTLNFDYQNTMIMKTSPFFISALLPMTGPEKVLLCCAVFLCILWLQNSTMNFK